MFKYLLPLLIILNIIPINGQTCLPDGIILTTQAQVNAFPGNYSGCTEIIGNLYIQGENISNLAPLAQVTKVNGELRVNNCPALTSLSGLHNITEVGTLSIQNMANLPNLQGLNNLTTVNNNIIFFINPGLTSLNGINNLSGSINGVLYIHVAQNLTNIQALSNLTNVGGYMRIAQCSILQNLNGLNSLIEIGGLQMYSNDLLSDISSLSSITSSTRAINIQNTPQLSTLNGLQNVVYTEDLLIRDCPLIQNLNELSSLTSISGTFQIRNNASLTDISGLTNVNMDNISTLAITNNPNLPICNYLPICEILLNPEAYITIEDNGPGCSSIEELEQECESVLPVTLITFDVAKSLEGNLITWQAEITSGFESFEIQVSKDGYKNWEELEIIDVRHTPDGVHPFQYNQKNPSSGSNYYRLEMRDTDGSVAYSPIVVVQNENKESIRIYPNPSITGYVNIEIKDESIPKKILLTDLTGREIYNVSLNDFNNKIQIDLADVVAGLYLIKITYPNGEGKVEKLIVF